jgi:hypothetical protein
MAKFHASDQREEITQKLQSARGTGAVVSVLQVAFDNDRAMGGVRGRDTPAGAELALEVEVSQRTTRLETPWANFPSNSDIHFF